MPEFVFNIYVNFNLVGITSKLNSEYVDIASIIFIIKYFYK